jgi:hypothetical protein
MTALVLGPRAERPIGMGSSGPAGAAGVLLFAQSFFVMAGTLFVRTGGFSLDDVANGIADSFAIS